MIASSINERMQKRLDYKTEEVRVLKEILRAATGKSRIDFNESQRKRLAIKGKELRPEERAECCEIVRPRTILEWFRRIYAEKYDSSKSRKRPGRPRKPEETRRLVLAIANDNLSWGYTKIRDAVNAGLGIDICRSTVANILNEAGIVPAPERDKRRTWKYFMQSHWDSLYACDFFAVGALGVFGAVRHMVFFVVNLDTREVHIAGIRVNPDGAWMKQVARNLTDPVDGFLRDATHLIHDADPVGSQYSWVLIVRIHSLLAGIPARSGDAPDGRLLPHPRSQAGRQAAHGVWATAGQRVANTAPRKEKTPAKLLT